MRKITKMVAITRLLGIFNVLQKGRFYVNWRSWDIQNCKYIFVNKEKCLFLYLWTCGYLSYTVGIKGEGGGGSFPSESQSLLQRYTITTFTARLFLPAQVSDARYEAANESNSLPISWPRSAKIVGTLYWGSQWGGGFYGYRLKFWLFYGYRLIFFSYG